MKRIICISPSHAVKIPTAEYICDAYLYASIIVRKILPNTVRCYWS